VTPQQIERIIERIAWGHKYISVKDSSERELLLIVKALSLQSRNWINFIYDRALSTAINSGFLTEPEILKQVTETGVWNEDNYRNLKKEIELAKEKLTSDEFSAREKKNLKSILNGLTIKFDELEKTRYNLFSNSAEKYAEDIKIKAIVFSSVFNEDGEKFWASWDEFLSEEDNALLSNITIAIYEASKDKLKDKQIREVARSPMWRYRWSAAKNIDYLFGKSVIELTDDQASLVYWSQLYDSVYDAYERPPEDIINDDDKLDEWLSEQSETRKKEIKEKFVDKKVNKISSRTAKHSEIGIVTNPALQADLERANKMGLAKNTEVADTSEVYDMNSDLAKKFLKVQEDRIKKAGVIEERDLRRDSDSRRVIGAQDAIISIRGGKKQVEKLLPGGTLKGRK